MRQRVSRSVEMEQWLSLGEASALLGVHTSTLRRWADNGLVPCQRTPGGHRRFSRQGLLPLLNGGAAGAKANLAPSSAQPWHRPFAEAGQIEAMRELCQRLGGVLLQYVLRTGDDRRLIEEARSLGRTLAEQSLAAAVDLPQAIQAYLYYRASFLSVGIGSPVSEERGSMGEHVRYDELMGQVLVGLIDGYVGTPVKAVSAGV